jgi:hypothetical protein
MLKSLPANLVRLGPQLMGCIPHLRYAAVLEVELKRAAGLQEVRISFGPPADRGMRFA